MADLRISLPATRRLILTVSAVVALLGVGAEVAAFELGWHSWIVPRVSLSHEGNVPSWWSTILLFSSSCALFAIGRARKGEPLARDWTLLGAIFLYISLDEAAQLHETLNGASGHGGALHFAWVLPAVALVTIFGLRYLPFLARIAPRRRRQLVVAGLLYVGGALGVELLLGLWTDANGSRNLVYRMIDALQESGEIFGAALFLLALLEELSELQPRLSIER